ncbi:DNA modification system-associated small protein [Bacillus sp. Marseille-P3661]|uniref:DNA modification system-associated small protein n=1 Tax=Bacillus sp. Marseille-P3661 TaxID=1936234 RepID=UPI000C822F74|nr:DNA modification system-associated small protein [Bacillus sp. Marseille-P3661]
MKEIKKREIELLAKVCNQNNISLKLAREIIRASEKFSYENVSQGNRINEYQELIDYFSKNN